MINLASLSFHFDPLEDRIRLIGNLANGQPRLDFWLTRRLVLRLLEASTDLIRQTSSNVSQTPASHQPAMAQFEHDQAQQQASIQREQAGQHDEPAHLLQRLDISYRQERYQLSFFETGESQPVAFSYLNYQEMHQVLHWLHKGCRELEWGVAASLFDQDQVLARLQ